MDSEQLQRIAKKLRLNAVKMVYEGGDGHPGPALSIADIVTTLYFDELKLDPANPSWEDRDRFILSKGHGCPIYYAALMEKGFFDDLKDNKLRALGSIFQGHPEMKHTPGVDMTTGSLGNGIAIGAGMAYSAKYRNKDYGVFVLVGDGELQEGVCWEGINTAAALELDNLIAFVDQNGWQSGGTVLETIGSENIKERFEAFCWHAQEIDGHNFDAIKGAIEKAKETKGKPSVIVCNDVKGKGVSFMENDNKWHKGVPTQEEFALVIKELGEEA